jgi:hypothetical protein
MAFAALRALTYICSLPCGRSHIFAHCPAGARLIFAARNFRCAKRQTCGLGYEILPPPYIFSTPFNAASLDEGLSSLAAAMDCSFFFLYQSLQLFVIVSLLILCVSENTHFQ